MSNDTFILVAFNALIAKFASKYAENDKQVVIIKDGLDTIKDDNAAMRKRIETAEKIPGPIGPVGKNGRDGMAGERGAPGANGKDGRDGERGKTGATGKDGKDGAPGAEGKVGDTGPMPKHEWRGSELRFEQSPKKWGKWTDLRGPAGASGGGGYAATAQQGGTFDPSTLPAAASTPTPSEIIVLQDGQWVRASWAQFKSWAGAPTGVSVNGEFVTVNGEKVFVNGE